MELEDKINQVADKIRKLKDTIQTEEATKTAFIMPFISDVLGYDVFDPSEVVPEFTADVGTKKHEKVDYALVLDGTVQILIECKQIGSPLTLNNASQLFRYYACTEARIGILTNGQVWNFYMDIDAPNKMDSKPFLVLDLLDVDKTLLPKLEKLTKPSFDLGSIASSAEEMKYVSALKREIADEFASPSDDFVKLLSKRVYDKPIRQSALDKFRPLVEKALKRYLADQVNNRLATALGADGEKADGDKADGESGDGAAEDHSGDIDETCGDGIVTTDEEIAAYRIVKAIACSEVAPERVTMRDAKSYCAVFLDDNNRKPVLRLYFNSSQKKIAVFEDGSILSKEPIESLDDIYRFTDAIRKEVRYLLAD